MREGVFREDLFYRLAVVPIRLPPLRDRRDDIPGLCELFCRKVATELKIPRRKLSPEALQKLRHYRFPGNLRELRNLIERAFVLSSNEEIGPNDLPLVHEEAIKDGLQGDQLSIPLGNIFDLTGVLEKAEKDLIVRTLQSTRGAHAEAARRMGLSRSALAYKLAKYGIRSE